MLPRFRAAAAVEHVGPDLRSLQVERLDREIAPRSQPHAVLIPLFQLDVWSTALERGEPLTLHPFLVVRMRPEIAPKLLLQLRRKATLGIGSWLAAMAIGNQRAARCGFIVAEQPAEYEQRGA